jgi:hypothetical protein
VTDTSVEKFRLFVEQLEMIRRLLDTKSPIDSKVAIILLDNVGDALMYRRFVQEFDEDSYLAVIKRPRFTLSKRIEILQDFKAKVNALAGLKFINLEDASVLKIGHSYRNAAYHRDVHNPRVTNEIARILFDSVSSLFNAYYKNGASVGGIHLEAWGLSNYGVTGNFISFESASTTVIRKLRHGISITLVEARTALQNDIESRLRKLDCEIAKIPIIGPESLDEGLKQAEFSEEHPREEFLQELRELNYRITLGQGDRIAAKEYRSAEALAQRRRRKAYSDFVPICSSVLLARLKRSQTLRKARSMSALLFGYQDLDTKVSRFEVSIEQIAIAFDRAVQLEIDLRRGK